MPALATPIGTISYRLAPSGALAEIWFDDRCSSGEVSAQLEREFAEFFRHERRAFDFPLEPKGTPFQQSVWSELLKIPFGETRSYLQIAKAIGQPAATRAVGTANGANPIPIIIPCHRVIGSNGKLTGYGGGLEMKSRLLDFEQGNLFS
jgi:methylated-DNA-[protein]-cysteine S-methyltransferase